MSKLRVLVFRKVGPPNVCHVAHEDVEEDDPEPIGTRITRYLGGDPEAARAITAHDRDYPGCRVVMASRGDTYMEVWEDPTLTSSAKFHGVVLGALRYIHRVRASVAEVLAEGRSGVTRDERD